ncbi:N-acetyl-gamma-glutamyl-phosphate reductase [Alphaproteobacteria bacterium]|nr:N-acetyl-gamma-glutamyl-phosphate reductase [Alphaproteobacteria bacterium]
MKKNIFIDGEVGTTGLQVHEKLRQHPNVNILPVDYAKRKDPSYKRQMLEASDVTFLCLPDDSAIETAKIADELDNKSPIIIDASTVHRTNPNWSYGLPELGPNYRNRIVDSKRIAVPGCYATGANVIIKPLLESKLISPNQPLVINAVSGYSGGGKELISYFNEKDHAPQFNYGLKFDHKHLPEIKFHNNLEFNPIFSPSVGDFIQGMIVSIPIHFTWFVPPINTKKIQSVMEEFYLDSQFIKVLEKNEGLNSKGHLRPDNLVDTNLLDINIFGNDANEQIVICSRLDNLGKGASGAAVQCMNIALGYDEKIGL